AAPQAQQTVTVGVTADKMPQTITFTSTVPEHPVVGGDYTPTASASSHLPVALSIDASSTDVCTLADQHVSFTATGTCVIDANQPGADPIQAAPQAQQTVTVGGVAPTITTSGPGSFTV